MSGMCGIDPGKSYAPSAPPTRRTGVFPPRRYEVTAVWTFAGPSTALDRGYSGSGRGSLNHGGVADHIGWRAPTCLNLFAQKCHRVLTGRAPGGVAPLWE